LKHTPDYVAGQNLPKVLKSNQRVAIEMIATPGLNYLLFLDDVLKQWN
jgi:hypothetical protein